MAGLYRMEVSQMNVLLKTMPILLLLIAFMLHEVVGDGIGVQAAGPGTVVGWGWDAFGQSESPAGLSGVTAIAAGGYHNLALKSDGTVTGWGRNVEGET